MDGMAVAPFLEFATSSVSDRRWVVEVVHFVVVHVDQLRHPSAAPRKVASNPWTAIGFSLRVNLFGSVQDIEHRLTKPNHPWTNGQVERMNRTLKEATVRRYHYDTHRDLREHLEAFLNAYNFAKRLKTLKGLTPYEHICNVWADQPSRFRYDPFHLTSGQGPRCRSHKEPGGRS